MPITIPHAIALRREPGPLTRSLTALLLRVALGMIFLVAGLGKFEAAKAGKYPAAIEKQFEGSKLRPDMVKLFATALPYAEVGIGVLLLAGLFTTLSAALAGVLLAHLLFGQLVLNNTTMFPSMLTYVLVNAGILWLSPVTSNYFSLDGLFFGPFRRPRTQGEYRREEADEVVAPRGRRV